MLSASRTQFAKPRKALRVVASQERQACGQCRTLFRCWTPKIGASARVINLLVCRLERDIDYNRTLRVLLKMLQPKLSRIAKRTATQARVHGGTETADDILRHLQRVVVESLKQYRMGEVVGPLHWLFGKRRGGVTMWTLAYLTEARREERRRDKAAQMLSPTAKLTRPLKYPRMHTCQLFEADQRERERETQLHALATQAQAIIDDGITLSLSEYRVLRFCLSNAREARTNHLGGVHRACAEVTGQARKTVGRHFGTASRRLVEAAGHGARYFHQKTLTIPSDPAARRRRRLWLWRLSESGAAVVTPEEIYAIVALRRARPDVCAADVAWLYGVSEDFVYRLQRRFGDNSLAEIQQICNRQVLS